MTKDQIRKETPLSVTSTDNPIYICENDVLIDIYDRIFIDGVLWVYKTLDQAHIVKGDLLRLLQCYDDDRPNHYRWGDEDQFVVIQDEYMQFISGNLGPRI